MLKHIYIYIYIWKRDVLGGEGSVAVLRYGIYTLSMLLQMFL